MNYTDKQIKLAGVIQPEGGAREFEQGLDLQGEGVRVLQNDSTIFEENTGDCCEDLQTCELAVNACEAEREELELENEELAAENEELQEFFDGVVGGNTFSESTYGTFTDGTRGSLVAFISLTSSFDPSTSTVTMYAYGYVIISGDPRISGTVATISTPYYWKSDGSDRDDINNSSFHVSTSNPNLSATTTSSYNPAFAPAGYVSGNKGAVTASGGVITTPFTWSPLPQIPPTP